MKNSSQKQLLKATGIIGGSQVIVILIGIVRTKIIAILLGPSGVGIVGMLQSILDLIRNLSGFGLNYSAVKYVAEADSSEDKTRIVDSISVLKKLIFLTGGLGVLIMLLFADKLSKMTFGNSNYTITLMYLSITLLFSSLSGGQIAVLQGKREIKKMSYANMGGAIATSIFSIIFYYIWGYRGIIPVLVFSSLIPFLFSWYYTKNLFSNAYSYKWNLAIKNGFEMAKLGFFIVITGFMSTLTLYIVRHIILIKLNIESVGIFQASWMITNIYIGVILNAMLSDFFPRLSILSNDNVASNKLINEQLELALILGVPMIIIFISLSPLIVNILYSSSFLQTFPLLQWQLLGSFFTLIMWPIGVLFLSRNRGIFSIVTDGIWAISYVVLIYFLWDSVGFLILGIAFFVASFFKLVAVYFFAIKVGDFSFSRNNIFLILKFAFLSFAMIVNVSLLTGFIQYIISFLLIGAVLVQCYSKIKNLFFS
ncbi:oligosaccharide flippase family protein [Aquirufa antheringensis]|uniref:oligosaccharide flippase family protein n=1 Tax=Aquirufa antheringensis TaxID=2516559 RepID=UPI0022A89561|nr:oligosaccharide flippase family protein [Aquirufa antheringensis]MCZ2486952.1 oligosaccharide flippase family protein [Aquirufa antheringensis]